MAHKFGQIANLQTGFCKLDLAENIPANPEVYRLTDEGEFLLVGVALRSLSGVDGKSIECRLKDGSIDTMYTDKLWVSKDYRHVPFKRST